MNNDLTEEEEFFISLNEREDIYLAEEETFFLQQEEENSQKLNPENQTKNVDVKEKVKSSNKPLKNHQLPSEKITTKTQQKGLYYLNKNLSRVAKQLTNQPDLNGLFISGLIMDSLTQIAEPFLEPKIDKQAAGVAVINRLQDILPDRFVGNSREPFIWKDPYLDRETYQFEVEGGDLIQEKGKTKLTPKHLKAKEINSGKEVFQASSLDNRNWHIEKCKFNSGQLRALVQAENLISEEKKGQLNLGKKNIKPSKNIPNQDIEIN